MEQIMLVLNKIQIKTILLICNKKFDKREFSNFEKKRKLRDFDFYFLLPKTEKQVNNFEFCSKIF